MSLVRRVLVAGIAVVVALPAASFADDTKPYVFRGVEPGVTTAEALRANERWGKPRKEETNADGSVRWVYEPQGYKRAVVTLRGDRAQTLDVLLPDGVSVNEAARALKLGIPVEGATLGDAARVGATMPRNWEPVAYSAGRVVLFVDRQRGQAMALRSYSGTLLDAGPASSASAATSVPAAVTRRTQDARGREIVAGLARVLPQNHISGHPVDGEIARRTRQLFIDYLDAARLYFTRDDITRAGRDPESFAAQLRQGDVGQLYELFRVFLERLGQRREMFDKLIADEPDYTVDEQYDLTQYADTWAENDLEMREAWRKRIKYDLLSHLEAGATDEEARERVAANWRTRFDNWQRLSDDDLLAAAATSLCNAFDPRSAYYTPRAYRETSFATASQYVGIGASLQVNQGYTDVVKVIAGGSAATDGRLQAGDRIVAVGGADGEMTDIVGMPLADVVDRIRGPEGSVVRLRVLPKGGFEAKVIELTRRKFEMQNLGSTVLKANAAGLSGDAKIGYVYVPMLYTDSAAQDAGSKDYRSTARDLQKILDGLRSSDVDVAVIDLRDNPGGLLTEAIEVGAHFVGGGPALLVRDSQGRTEFYQPETKPPVWDRPLVLITNKGTSGGGEIIAAAVQDYRRGIVVGDSVTNGNGTIGSQRPLVQWLDPSAAADAERLGVARINMQKFYRVKGQGIQSSGVAPDLSLPSFTEVTGSLQSELPYALSFDTVTAANFTPAASVDGATVEALAAASQERRERSDYFRQLVAESRQLGESRSIVSLNKDKFFDERRRRTKLDADATPLPTIEDVKLTPYLQEVFAIALDYAAQRHLASAEAALEQRRYADALAAMRRAVAVSPDSKTARYRLAWSLATLPSSSWRNGKQAVEHARELCKLDGRQNWVYLLTLAVAEAEAGNFDAAQTELDAALEKAPEDKRSKYTYLRDRFRRKQKFASR